MNIKTVIQRDQLSQILCKTIVLFCFILISALVTLVATQSAKTRVSRQIRDVSSLATQECERKMTENVQTYQEELRLKFEKEWRIGKGENVGSETVSGDLESENADLKLKLTRLEQQYEMLLKKYGDFKNSRSDTQ